MEKISLKQLIEQISAGLDAVEADFLGVSPFHGKRVALLCIYIGRVLGYEETHLFNLAGCGLLHDNALTEYLLSERPGKDQEINMRTHCIKGEENCSYFPFQGDCRGYVLYHHEKADGSGAFQKKMDEYPEEAGIIALADQLDVRFHLWKPQEEKVCEIRKYLQRYRGIWYEEKLADAAIEAITEENMNRLQDECVADWLEKEMPAQKTELDTEEVIRVAGIVAKIIDYKSSFTKEHTLQIANKAWYMSGIYQYDREMRSRIYLAAALHDIGKLFIPTEILEKPGKLTAEEFEIIKSHAWYTWKSLHDVDGIEEIADWASNHHEKLDGSGYPFGRKAAELDFVSRLIACLDIYQAVREVRPYHPARDHEGTIAILKGMAEQGFIDREIVRDLDIHLKGLAEGRADKPIIEHT